MKKEKLKACAKCGYITDQKSGSCPACGSTEFVERWKGEVIIFDLDSQIAKVLGAKKPGRYAIQLP